MNFPDRMRKATPSIRWTKAVESNPPVLGATFSSGKTEAAFAGIQGESGAPLHFAAQEGHAAAIAALFEAGGDPVARTGDGRIPFDLIPEDSPLIGTPVYRRLNDASRK